MKRRSFIEKFGTGASAVFLGPDNYSLGKSGKAKFKGTGKGKAESSKVKGERMTGNLV